MNFLVEEVNFVTYTCIPQKSKQAFGISNNFILKSFFDVTYIKWPNT